MARSVLRGESDDCCDCVGRPAACRPRPRLGTVNNQNHMQSHLEQLFRCVYLQAGRLLSKAMAYRHTRSHRLNDHSSRSHCIITLTFNVKERDGDQPGCGSLPARFLQCNVCLQVNRFRCMARASFVASSRSPLTPRRGAAASRGAASVTDLRLSKWIGLGMGPPHLECCSCMCRPVVYVPARSRCSIPPISCLALHNR